jgi:hypothetical protein
MTDEPSLLGAVDVSAVSEQGEQALVAPIFPI